MSVEPFLEPRLVGARFEGHAVPLEVLKDLAVLQDMIVEVAKWKFLQENPDRKRSPRGFADGIELKLTGVEAGSARLLISLVVATGTLFPEIPPYFEKAREAVVGAIAAAEQRQDVTQHLPDNALGYFDRIGRSLRADEAMEFSSPSSDTPARLTRETRRTLVLASEQVREYTEEITLRGGIPEADQDDMTFELQMLDGKKISAPIPAQHMATILEGFNGYTSGIRVLIEGIVKFSRQGRLRAFESVERISILEALDVPARLDEFRLLKDGWLEGGGKAPDSDGLNWLSSTFVHHYPDNVPLPFTYPTPEGGIQFEWSLGANEASLEINLQSHSAEWNCLNADTNAEAAKMLNLNEAQYWAILVNDVRQLTGETA